MLGEVLNYSACGCSSFTYSKIPETDNWVLEKNYLRVHIGCCSLGKNFVPESEVTCKDRIIQSLPLIEVVRKMVHRYFLCQYQKEYLPGLASPTMALGFRLLFHAMSTTFSLTYPIPSFLLLVCKEGHCCISTACWPTIAGTIFSDLSSKAARALDPGLQPCFWRFCKM